MIGTGVWLFPDQPASTFIDTVAGVETLGLSEVWVGDEGPARDPFALLAAAACRTTTLRLGVGVTNPYVRHPGVTATSAMTIHEISGGRFVLGLGVGGDVALSPFGIAAVHPLASCREALATIRAVSRGEAAAGYTPPAHAFGAADLPVYVGARGEKLNRWASAEADGVFVAGIAPALVGDVIGWARSVRPIEVALYLSACFSLEEVERVRPRLLHAFLDAPARLREHAGLPLDALQDAASALAGGDEAPARCLLDDDRLSMVLAHGSPVLVAERLAQLARAHRPQSIGIALLGPELEAAAEALHLARRELL